MTLDDVWRAAAPYLRVRKNDIHVPISFDYAEWLLEEHPQADGLVVRLAILLHDIGWYTIDERDIFSEGFGKNWKQSNVRYLHESEGCRMAMELLGNLGYDDATIGQVVAIIDGHDTRPEALARRYVGSRRRQAVALYSGRHRHRLRLVQPHAFVPSN